MKNCVEYEINEGCLSLLLILENMYISEMVKIPKEIYNEIDKLYSMLVDYIERDYKNIEVEDTKTIRRVFIDTLEH